MAAFLLANMVYTDGLVSLFAFGGIYAAGTFGWNTIQIGTFGILLAIAGTFGAWLGGKLETGWDRRRVIAGSMLMLLLAIVAILLVDRDSVSVHQGRAAGAGRRAVRRAAEQAYLALGCLIGMAGGPLQAASRTLLIRLAPKDRIAQYFGLFALTGKVTSFVGPLLVGIVTARDRQPEGRHGGAGGVFRRRAGAAGAGAGLICSRPWARAGRRGDP